MKCEKCGSEDIEMKQVKEFEFSFKQKMLAFVAYPIVAFLIVGAMFAVNSGIAVILLFAFLIGWIAILYTMNLYRESMKKKPRARCMCKNCGHIWYINEK